MVFKKLQIQDFQKKNIGLLPLEFCQTSIETSGSAILVGSSVDGRNEIEAPRTYDMPASDRHPRHRGAREEGDT